MDDGILSFDPARHQPELLSAWETFIKTGKIERKTVPSYIADSWMRSKRCKVNPYDFARRSYLKDEKYRKRIQANEDLIGLARPIMENVYSSLEQTRYLVVLYDPDGYHLLRIGQRADIQRSSEFKIREGLCFDENHVGTSGFSLVKRLQKPIQITGCEHYSMLLHYVTGAYAPIFSPQTRKLIGVIGVSGARTLPNSHTLAIVVAASTAIENLLELNKAKDELSIYTESLQTAIDTFEDGVILIDKSGRNYETNRAAKQALGLEKRDFRGRHISELRSLASLEGAVMRALSSDDRDGKEIECQIRNETYLASIKFIRKGHRDVRGVMVQLKNVRSLSRIFQTLTGDQPKYTIDNMVGANGRMKEVRNMVQIAARSNAHVIIQGESGTGKEVLAQAIHNASPRKREPFIVVNCAAIPTELLESTLFGHEKGAFTGATGTHIGKFELADGGTLFLDEIADMSPGMQAKILRVIEERKIERVGGKNHIPIDVRILAATNRDLNRLMSENLFREDLFFRLNVFRIELPPLRERKDDIAELVHQFVAEFGPIFQKRISRVSDGYLDALMKYDWPGNIRELRNAVQYSIARMEGDNLLPIHGQGFFNQTPGSLSSAYSTQGTEKLADLEQQLILETLKIHHGNKAETAKTLGIGRATLYRKLKSMSHMDTVISK